MALSMHPAYDNNKDKQETAASTSSVLSGGGGEGGCGPGNQPDLYMKMSI